MQRKCQLIHGLVAGMALDALSLAPAHFCPRCHTKCKKLICFITEINRLSYYRVRLYSKHYSDVIMGAMASQITNLTIVYSTLYSGADQTKHQSSASLASVRGIHRWPVNSQHKWPVTRKMFSFDDVIICGQTSLTAPDTTYGQRLRRVEFVLCHWNQTGCSKSSAGSTRNRVVHKVRIMGDYYQTLKKHG